MSRSSWNKIKLLLMDVDGVLADSRVFMSDKTEFKRFSIIDGMGITLLHKSGIKTALISSRFSKTTQRRAKELGIQHVFQGSFDKLDAFQKIKQELKLEYNQIAYVGDDVVDIPILKRVGLPIAVANARPEVKAFALYITRAEGGNGAIREIAERLLKSQRKWSTVLGEFVK